MADKQKTFPERVESLFKLVGTALGILVVFGYPAIYYQMKSFDLPLHVIGYKNVFYAGIIPTLIFVGFFAYGYWVYFQLQKGKSMESILTIAVVGMPLLLIEVVALVVMIFYGYIWVLARLPVLFGWQVTRAGMIDLSLVLVGLVVGYQILVTAFPSAELWLKRSFRRVKNLFNRKRREEPTINESPETPEIKEVKVKEPVNDKYAVFGGLVFAAMTFLGYLSLMWIIENRYPALDNLIEPYKPLFFRISVILSCILGVLFPISLMRNHTVGRVLFFSLFTLAFLVLVYMYSTQWYKQIDIRLGGGRPEPVNIWVKTSDFPEPILARYAQRQPKDSSVYTNWQNGLLLLENDKLLAITSRDSAWVIIPKDKVLVFERIARKRR